MIIGREKELAILREAKESEYSSFIAVYGRRRIGKTYLVREAYGYDFSFQHAGLYKGTKAQQLSGFASSLNDAGLNIDNIPKNWMQAFDMLKSLIKKSKKKKKVIFIDELSWMDTPRSDLMLALEFFWNSWASARKDIVLVVCASATSWMVKKVIHNKGGLYNRLSHQIQLKPFTLLQCEEMSKAYRFPLSRGQIAEYYMAMGGIPYYWTLLNRSQSIPQNIDRLLYGADAPLKREYNYLFASIFNSPEPYVEIIETLAKKRFGLTRLELLESVKKSSGGKLSEVLEDLENCGFIRKYHVTDKRRLNCYQLIDNFVIYYHHFIKQNQEVEHFWTDNYLSPKLNTWHGLAFELLALQHITQIKRKLQIEGVSSNNFAWTYRGDGQRAGAQIDLVIDRKDDTVTLCEMKYSNIPYVLTKSDEENLLNKIDALSNELSSKKSMLITLIASNGLKPNAHSSVINSVVTLDDLFT